MFRNALKWAAPLVAFGLLISLSAIGARAEDAKKDTGSVSGTVVDKDGKPVAGAEVSIFHPMHHNKSEKQAEKPAKGDKPVSVVPSVKSDDNGAFTLSDVPAGEYLVRAALKGQGQARQDVEIKAGETAKVELKLMKGSKGGGTAGAEKPKTESAK